MIIQYASVDTWFVGAGSLSLGLITDWSVGGEYVPPGGGTNGKLIQLGYPGGISMNGQGAMGVR